MNTKQKGKISEAIITLELVKQGFVVLQPIGDNERYDIVIDRGYGFERVQCKTGTYRNGVITYNTCNTMPKSNGGYTIKPYTESQIELFAVYCEHTDEIYLIPVNEAPKSSGTLRVKQTRNNQVKNCNFAEDYKLR